MYTPPYASTFNTFALPGQNIGQWIAWNPAAGSFTFTVAPGFPLSYVWMPSLTTAIALYAATSVTGTAFYTTGSGGAEGVPLPSGLTAVTLSATPSGSGSIMPVYFSSLPFDPVKNSYPIPGVSSVGATYPLTSTCGVNPVVALSTPLPVAYGGTGSTAPSLVAGSGMTVTGTWPNQTIATASGFGTVTAVTAVSPLVSSGGTAPSISLGVTPIANGGTGTASPALTAGTGISITGSWPNNTIAYGGNIVPQVYKFGTLQATTPTLACGYTDVGDNRTQAVTFGFTFASGPIVVLGQAGGQQTNVVSIVPGSISETGFTANNPGNAPATCFWLAIGQ